VATFLSTRAAISFAMGFFLMTISVGVLYWMMKRLLEKKAVAVGLLIIVFKYAIWFLVLYFLSRGIGLDLLWIMAGILISLAGLVGANFLFNEGKADNGSSTPI
ncbi:MAG: hypothetical protein AB7H97_11155, partial [Pseudobdellovibrionaceae bacterium]